MKSNHKRLNYVDLLLAIAIIIILTIFISTFFGNTSKVDFTAKETITVTMRIKDIPIKHAGLIKNGDDVFFSENEEAFGIVKYVSYDDETVEFLDKLTNTSTIYRAPDKKTALVLVEAEAEFTDGNYFINSKKIEKSDTAELFVPAYSFTATVVNIDNNKD